MVPNFGTTRPTQTMNKMKRSNKMKRLGKSVVISYLFSAFLFSHFIFNCILSCNLAYFLSKKYLATINKNLRTICNKVLSWWITKGGVSRPHHWAHINSIHWVRYFHFESALGCPWGSQEGVNQPPSCPLRSLQSPIHHT